MKPFLIDLAWTLAGTFILAATLTGIVLVLLRRRAIYDRPNQRSLHDRPVPRGGGWGIILAVLPLWIWGTARAGWLGHASELLLLVGCGALIAVSWADDRRGLSARLRFAVQLVAVGTVVAALPADLSLTGGLLPSALDRVAAAAVWIWFVNLFNFMDGIDGLAGGSAAAMAGGLMLIAMLEGPDQLAAFRDAVIAAAALGFLVWNWHPAKIFLGDVGSVPLGYLLGYQLLLLAMEGHPVPALVVALYYLADATLTLFRRVLRGERPWRAHFDHFYQRAVRAGRSHAQVAATAILVQLALALAGLASLRAPGPMLAGTAVLVVLLLVWMSRRPAPGR